MHGRARLVLVLNIRPIVESTRVVDLFDIDRIRTPSTAVSLALLAARGEHQLPKIDEGLSAVRCKSVEMARLLNDLEGSGH